MSEMIVSGVLVLGVATLALIYVATRIDRLADKVDRLSDRHTADH